MAVAMVLLPGSVCMAQPTSAQHEVAGHSSEGERMVVNAVTLNGESVGSWLLITRQDTWFASEEALSNWRVLVRDDAPRLTRHGQRWLALNALPGCRTQENTANQSLAVWLDPIAFESTHLGDLAPPAPDTSPVEPALYLNLDVNYTRIQARHTGNAPELTAFSEIG